MEAKLYGYNTLKLQPYTNTCALMLLDGLASILERELIIMSLTAQTSQIQLRGIYISRDIT